MRLRKFSCMLGLLMTCSLVMFADCGMSNEWGVCESDNCCDPCELYCGGLWVGNNFGSLSDWALMVGWYTECFLIDFGYNYQSIEVNEPRRSFHVHNLRGHIGLRHRMCCSNLFLAYGIVGSYGVRSNTSATRTRPHEIGVFAGLDYQLSRHFLISGKLAPYLHRRDFTKTHLDEVFSRGSLTFAYVF